MGMSQFNYEIYAEAIKELAMLPAKLQQFQQETETLFLNKKEEIASVAKLQLDELKKAENIVFQQFNDVSCEYKILFSVPVSRPKPIPTPLSLKDAATAQNIFALRLKSHFDKVKQEAVEEKRHRAEEEKAKQILQASKEAQEKEMRQKQAEEIERQYEEEYFRQLEKDNRSIFKKFVDFLKGQ